MALNSYLLNEIGALLSRAQLSSGSPLELGDDVAASIRLNVGLNLSRLLKSKKLSQRDFSKELGVEESSVSKWVNGKALPDYKHFDRMRELYGWRFDELTRDPETLSPAEALLRTLDDAGLTIVKKPSTSTKQ